MRAYDENKKVEIVYAGYWYLVDGQPVRPKVTMLAEKYRVLLGATTITECDVYTRGYAIP